MPSSFAIALGLCFILPLLNYFREPPLGDFFGEWASATVMALGALLMIRTLPKRFEVNGVLLVLPGLIVALIVLQAALGRYVYFTDALFYTAYLTLFVLVAVLGQHFRQIGLAAEVAQRMAWAVILVALVNIAVQVAQLGRWDQHLQPWIVALNRDTVCVVYGNTGQANHTSSIAWLALFGSIYLAHERRMPVWLLAVLIPVFMFSSAITSSRMAWLFLGFGVALALLGRPRWTSTGKGRLTLAAGLIAAFVAVTAATGMLMGALDANCLSSVARMDAQEGGIAVRLDLLRQAALVWSGNPWIGTGAYSFNGRVYELVADGRSQHLDTYAHNIFAQVLAEFGLIGVLGLLIVPIACLWAIWRNRGELGAADTLLLAWLGVLGIHSLLEYPLWYVHFLMFFGLAIGLLLRPQWHLLRVALPARALVGSIAGGAVVACFFVLQDYRKLDRYMFLVLQKLENNLASSPEVNAILERADADVLIYRPHADHLRGMAMSMTRDQLSEKIAITDKLLSRAPTPQTAARRVVLAVLDDDLPAARWHMDRLMLFFPKQGQKLADEMREMARLRPDDLSALPAVLDASIAAAQQTS